MIDFTDKISKYKNVAHRSRKNFFAELKNIAKERQRRNSSKLSCELNALAVLLGAKDWQQLNRIPDPHVCENDVFLDRADVAASFPSLFEPLASKKYICSAHTDYFSQDGHALSHVEPCGDPAVYFAFLVKRVGVGSESVGKSFLQLDESCPYLCRAHALHNENQQLDFGGPDLKHCIHTQIKKSTMVLLVMWAFMGMNILNLRTFLSTLRLNVVSKCSGTIFLEALNIIKI